MARIMDDSIRAPRRENVRDDMPTHVIFCMVDHYEPGAGGVSRDTEINRVDLLVENYPLLAQAHLDSAGNHPSRTWFFPPHYHRHNALKKLVGLCAKGWGEIELHLHHGKSKPDTPENLKRTIEKCIEEYSLFGVFGQENKEKKYGFIHGDWALDNSRNGTYCGVNNELEILLDTGCYADFTFPCRNEANPAQINSIYYGVGKAGKSKSYNRGVPAQRGRLDNSGLMMIQGPSSLIRRNRSPLSLRLFSDVVDGAVRVSPARIKAWVNANIHIVGSPNVVFVKTHTHGATDYDAVVGTEMDFIFDYLETHYKKDQYRLHYATAREMYNIAKSIEAGLPEEDVENYRDGFISRPAYDPTPAIDGASDELNQLVFSSYVE